MSFLVLLITSGSTTSLRSLLNISFSFGIFSFGSAANFLYCSLIGLKYSCKFLFGISNVEFLLSWNKYS